MEKDIIRSSIYEKDITSIIFSSEYLCYPVSPVFFGLVVSLLR
jgi:hypothetical protein